MSAALERKALREAERLFGIFDGTRSFVMEVWILRHLLALARRVVDEDTHLALMTPCGKTRHPIRDCACAACERKRDALRRTTKPRTNRYARALERGEELLAKMTAKPRAGRAMRKA